ncbi:hypothetical protein [Adhaeretor mobilis]|uniref:Uncharacterized protein n=1 Tax=Adhaeretor mobilis TaxID=1930276 RepID=A0A517MVD2_9BACT|nr:hypothetical protein [Adhaeretor mobilis]QDS98840.1 hypothetical protein HG15A2_21250 [Adhaeretor mobilis]
MKYFLTYLRAILIAYLALWGGELQAINILFYGNSFTNGLGSTESVPNLVRDIATAAGHTTPTVVNAANNGSSFTWHLANNAGVISSGLPISEQWDFAVLQNFSTTPTHLGNVAQHRADSVSLYQQIAAHSPSHTPVLYETWARAPGHNYYTSGVPDFPGGPSEMQAELRNGYLLAAQDIDVSTGGRIARIAEVGSRWEDANWDNLHSDDLYHAQNRGTLLASLEIYSTIYQQQTSGIDLSSVLGELGLSLYEGQFLTSITDGLIPPDPPAPPDQVTLKFDFGETGSPDPKYNVVPWNAQDIEKTIDFVTGVETDISLTISSTAGFNEAGHNPSGTISAGSPASDFFNFNATADSLFGHDSNFNVGEPRSLVEYTLSGLDQNQSYDFTFFASRLGASDNRETQYDVAGDNLGTTFLNPAENLNNIAQLLDIIPDPNGEITLTIQKGPNNTNSAGFFYLGAMDMTSSWVQLADFDSDSDVDGSDFLIWQRGFGINNGATLSQGDVTDDGAVDEEDLRLWNSQYCASSILQPLSSDPVHVVPEPKSLYLLAFGLGIFSLGPSCAKSLSQYVTISYEVSHQ